MRFQFIVVLALILAAFAINSNEMQHVERCNGTPDQCRKI